MQFLASCFLLVHICQAHGIWVEGRNELKTPVYDDYTEGDIDQASRPALDLEQEPTLDEHFRNEEATQLYDSSELEYLSPSAYETNSDVNGESQEATTSMQQTTDYQFGVIRYEGLDAIYREVNDNLPLVYSGNVVIEAHIGKQACPDMPRITFTRQAQLAARSMRSNLKNFQGQQMCTTDFARFRAYIILRMKDCDFLTTLSNPRSSEFQMLTQAMSEMLVDEQTNALDNVIEAMKSLCVSPCEVLFSSIFDKKSAMEYCCAANFMCFIPPISEPCFDFFSKYQ